ncbi:PEGA domain-containing protein [Polyangium sp. 15x6]|uniref:PEGA domain-containing protein n=1 Tax=Polyangium sp. 15x6 TaxID=3042687 RepID=UPI00249A8D2F|nr:PEGA domain-containing protein [Polyangium sp. 15x6]MDI3286661.1 PEGA domain-containing protein [Polyangium sp. 15x6]
MLRLGLVPVLLCGLASPAWADAPIDKEEDEESAEDMRFRAFASLGDRERAAGHPRAAARAYMAALEVRSDPLIGGRLGVLFVQLGRPELAPELLLDAIHRATTSPKEREGFFQAHEAARAQGSWIELIVSHAGAAVTLDGEPADTGGHTASWFFVRAGEHEVRAKLDGYEEAVEKFTAVKGENRPVRITLKPQSAPPPAVPAVYEPEKDPPKIVAPTVVVGETKLSKQEDPYAYDDSPATNRGDGEKKGVRGSIGAGPVVVFGVASWMPAVGLAVGASLWPSEYVSLGIEGRAAWLTTAVGGEPISAMTAGGIASVCGHYRWFFGCALGHLGVINVDFSSQSYKPASFVNFKPGAGGRLGARVRVTPSFSLNSSADVLGLSSGLKIVAGETVLAEQPPVMITAQFVGVWEF